jgi:hypothetical protein
MATPTSSSNRSKRKGTKPITQGQNPQRGNRQKVSNAQVTNSSTRGSNTGSAKVTTGRGASKPAPKALPPGTKGGALATQGRAPLKGQPQLPPGRKGGSVEKAGPTVDVKANADKLPSTRTGGALVRTNSGPLARVSNAASSATKNLSKAGRALTGLKGGLAGTALAMGGSAAIDAVTNAYKGAIRAERGQRAAESGQSGRYVPGGQQSRGGMGGVGNIPPGEGPRNNPNFGKPVAKPPARPSASRPSQSTPSRSTASGGGGGGSQRSAAPQASNPAMPGRKWEDFNPNRGTSRTNNPLIDDTMKARMRQREEQQAATSGSSKSEDKSKYVASNGQQYAGPAFGNGSNKSDSSAIAQKSGSEKLKDAIDKQREKRKQQQQQILARRTGS